MDVYEREVESNTKTISSSEVTSQGEIYSF